MEKPEVKPAVCEVGQGTLPGCAALAFPYIPMQSNNPTRYSRTEALQTGTLFPGLDLPFKAAIQARTKLPNTALVELMALDFAVTELNLYLDTHPQDRGSGTVRLLYQAGQGGPGKVYRQIRPSGQRGAGSGGRLHLAQ